MYWKYYELWIDGSMYYAVSQEQTSPQQLLWEGAYLVKRMVRDDMMIKGKHNILILVADAELKPQEYTLHKYNTLRTHIHEIAEQEVRI